MFDFSFRHLFIKSSFSENSKPACVRAGHSQSLPIDETNLRKTSETIWILRFNIAVLHRKHSDALSSTGFGKLYYFVECTIS